MGIVDLNADQEDGLRRIFAHATHDERTVLSAAITGVMKRPIAARGADIAFALLQRAVNVDKRQARVGPTGHFNSMPDVAHNERELADAEAQKLMFQVLADPKRVSGCVLTAIAYENLLRHLRVASVQADQDSSETIRKANPGR